LTAALGAAENPDRADTGDSRPQQRVQASRVHAQRGGVKGAQPPHGRQQRHLASLVVVGAPCRAHELRLEHLAAGGLLHLLSLSLTLGWPGRGAAGHVTLPPVSCAQLAATLRASSAIWPATAAAWLSRSWMCAVGATRSECWARTSCMDATSASIAVVFWPRSAARSSKALA